MKVCQARRFVLGRLMKFFFTSLLISSVCLLAIIGIYTDIWADADELHRMQGPDTAECRHLRENPHALFEIYKNDKQLQRDIKSQVLVFDSERPEARLKTKKIDPAKCYLQHHAGAFEKSDYTLSFLEFSSQGELRLEQQMAELEKHLSAQSKHVVVVYVHGWRYDAHIGSRDVQRFNMMLGYTRRFMAYRCHNFNRYCDHKLTGIFVGWPGRVKADQYYKTRKKPWWCLTNECRLALALSLRGRKKISEKVSYAVLKKLKKIEHQLKTDQSSNSPPWTRNLLVTVGHSLGGNLLANAVKDEFKEAIAKHTAQTRISSALGDLVVLLNPASEAKNWIEVQRAVRKKNGIEHTSAPLGNATQAIRAHKRFPIDQNPVYISISSACEAPEFAGGKKNKSYFNKRGCDRNVFEQFPINQFFSGKFNDRQSKAIGHFNPDGKCANKKNIERGCPASLPKTPEFYGTTHEQAMQCPKIDDCGTPATFYNAMKTFEKGPDGTPDTKSMKDSAVCAIGDGWLYKSRQRVHRPSSGSTFKWSSFKRDGFADNRLHPSRKIFAQYNHSIYLQTGRFDITAGNDPFWNIRATASSIQEHGVVQSVKMWCSINQMFLDQIAAKP